MLAVIDWYEENCHVFCLAPGVVSQYWVYTVWAMALPYWSKELVLIVSWVMGLPVGVMVVGYMYLYV